MERLGAEFKHGEIKAEVDRWSYCGPSELNNNEMYETTIAFSCHSSSMITHAKNWHRWNHRFAFFFIFRSHLIRLESQESRFWTRFGSHPIRFANHRFPLPWTPFWSTQIERECENIKHNQDKDKHQQHEWIPAIDAVILESNGCRYHPCQYSVLPGDLDVLHRNRFRCKHDCHILLLPLVLDHDLHVEHETFLSLLLF